MNFPFNYLFFLLFASPVGHLNAQTWMTRVNVPFDEDAKAGIQCRDGSYIFTGKSEKSGNSNVFTGKLNQAGELVWIQDYGSPWNEVSYDIIESETGGYFITGYSNSPSAGGYNALLMYIDDSGDSIWSRSYGGPFIEWGLSICQTRDSGLVIAGFTDRIYSDALLIKTNLRGDTLWTRTFGGDKDDWAGCVRETSDGGLILTGFTASYSPDGSEDLWLIRTDSSGNLLWTKTFGGCGDDWGRAVHPTTDGGFIISGCHSDEVHSGSDLWIIRTGESGDSLWTVKYPDGQNSWAYASVDETPDHGFVTVGTIQKNDSLFTDILLVKVSPTGEIIWTRAFDRQLSDFGSSVVSTSDHGFYLTGVTHADIDGTGDVLCIKTDSLGRIISIPGMTPYNFRDSICRQFEVRPNPSDGRVVILLELSSDAEIRLEVHDFQGRNLGDAFRGSWNRDDREYHFDFRTFPGIQAEGLYFLRLFIRDRFYDVKKVVVKRG